MVIVRVNAVKNAPVAITDARARAKAIVASGVLNSFQGMFDKKYLPRFAEIESKTKIDSGTVLDEYEYEITVQEDKIHGFKSALEL